MRTKNIVRIDDLELLNKIRDKLYTACLRAEKGGDSRNFEHFKQRGFRVSRRIRELEYGKKKKAS